MNSKQPIETAPKGGGARRVTDPNWVEPPSILLFFDGNKASIGHWDWFYAEGGNGCTDGVAWVEDLTGERLVSHYGQPTHWMSLEDIKTAPAPATEAHLFVPLGDSKMIDSKWQFCLRLKRFFRTCFIADNRVSAHYERGWNDAVTSLMASIGPVYKRQEPFLRTLLEGSTQPAIPREQQISAALAELRVAFMEQGVGVEWPDLIHQFDATITKLGLGPRKEGHDGHIR